MSYVEIKELVEACSSHALVDLEKWEGHLKRPAFREGVYQAIPIEPSEVYRLLLLTLFEQEMAFRVALWRREINDPDDYAENIYHCAFLIYKVGNADDVFVMWKAKHLNMDIGAALGAEYFLGAGVRPTLELLKQSELEAAPHISEYIKGWASEFETDRELEAELANWEASQLEYFEMGDD
jgi:hypothetical protein